MNFDLTILGTGSAIPSFGRFSSAQVLHTHHKSFLIDCADGTQFQLRRYNVKTNRMGHWFISHLHGDHCFGIISVISTMGMLHHTNDIYIHAHPHLKPVLQAQLNYFCKDLPFKVFFEPIVLIVLLLVCIMYIVNGTYNSFIYMVNHYANKK